MAKNTVPIDVVFFDEPAAHKAEDYLGAYKGHVYSAVSLIAKLCSSVEIKLYTRASKNDVKEVESHPAVDVLWNANERMTWQQLREIHQTYYELVGEAVWLTVMSGSEIIEIIPLRPDWLSLKPDGKGGILYYEYTPGGIGKGVRLDVDTLLFDKDFDPKNMYRGFGKVRPASMSIDIDDYSNTWNRNFFFNSAMPSIILSTDAQLHPDAKKRIARKFQTTHGGVRNAHKVAFMDGGQMKVDQISTSMQELDFQASKGRLMEEILSVFHMSKSNLGITDDVNLANAQVQEQRLMKMVIRPRLVHFVGFLNEFYLPKFDNTDDLFFNFEDPVQEDVQAKVQLLTAASNGGWLTKNEIREELGYDPLDIGGDEIYQPLSMQPMGIDSTTPQPETESLPQEQLNQLQKPQDQQESQEPEARRSLFSFGKKEQSVRRNPYKKFVSRKTLKSKLAAPIRPVSSRRQRMAQMQKEISHDIKRLIVELMRNGSVKDNTVESIMPKDERDTYWKEFVAKSDVLEASMRKLLIELATSQQQIVIDKIEQHKHAIEQKTKLQASTFLYSNVSENKVWKKVLRPFIARLVRAKGDEELLKLNPGKSKSGITKSPMFDMSADEVVNFLESLGIQFVSEVNATTRAALIAEISEGIRAGESTDQLKRRVQDVYETLRGYRAEVISRTETLRSLNFATIESYKQSGVVEGKEWLTALDEKVRDAHRAVDGKVVPLNEPFIVGGERMMQPGDPSASVSNTVQCRCTLIPVTSVKWMAMQAVARSKKKLQTEELMELVAKKVAQKQLQKQQAQVEVQKQEVVKLKEEVGKLVEERQEILDQNKQVISERIRESLETQEKQAQQKRVENEVIARHEVSKIAGIEEKVSNRVKLSRQKVDALEVKREELWEEVATLSETVKKTISQANDKAKEITKSAKSEMKGLREMVNKALRKSR